MIAKVHKMKGDIHEESQVGLDEVEEFLKQKRCKVSRSRTKYEITLVATRG